MRVVIGVLAEAVVKELLMVKIPVLMLWVEGVGGKPFEVMEGLKVENSGDPESKDGRGKTCVGTDTNWELAMGRGMGGMSMEAVDVVWVWRRYARESDWDGELYELECTRCVGAECSCRYACWS